MLLFLLLCTSVHAQSNTNECFVLEGPTEYDFGEIDQHDTVEHTFVFKNNCSETVEVEQARAGCGCTAAVLSDRVIPPGGEAKIAVEFTPPRGSRGRTSKSIRLHLKGEQQPHTLMRISATVRTDLDIQPSYVQLTGAEVGKEIAGTFTVKNVSGKNQTVSGFTSNLLTYATTPGESNTKAIPLQVGSIEPTSFEMKPDDIREITIRLTPRHVGQINGMVRFKAGNNENAVQVFGVVREPLRHKHESGSINTD